MRRLFFLNIYIEKHKRGNEFNGLTGGYRNTVMSIYKHYACRQECKHTNTYIPFAQDHNFKAEVKISRQKCTHQNKHLILT